MPLKSSETIYESRNWYFKYFAKIFSLGAPDIPPLYVNYLCLRISVGVSHEAMAWENAALVGNGIACEQMSPISFASSPISYVSYFFCFVWSKGKRRRLHVGQEWNWIGGLTEFSHIHWGIVNRNGTNYNDLRNAPINSKLQHPPPGIPRAFDFASCPGRGEFEPCVGRVGNLNQI